jgi:hypothetical protein
MPIKLACFDLDDTIINGHLGRALHNAGVVPGKADPQMVRTTVKEIGGLKNPQALKATLRKLLAANINIAVTSYTDYPETIPAVLEMAGLTPPEIAQIHIASFAPPKLADGHIDRSNGKNQHIQAAIESFGGAIRPEEVALIDDNMNHYELAKQKGYNVVWVQGSEGDVRYLNEVRELAGLSQAVVIPPVVVEVSDLPKQSWVDKVLGWFGVQRIPSTQGMER